MSVTFRGGRLAPVPTKQRLHLAGLLAAAPPPPQSVDWYSRVDQWPMFMNDELGCCTEAMVGHTIQNTSTYGDGATVTITDDDVLTAYERVSGYRPGHPETDQGAVLQDVFNDWRKTGVGGHKARAFGEVRVTSRDQIKTAINTFGALGLGLVVTQQMMDDFNAGRGWSRAGGRQLGGHAVVAVGYTPGGVYVVTWGEVVLMTWAVFNRTVEEAWAAILDEWVNDVSLVSPLGDALYALGEDLTDLTGAENPFPEPGPTPTPPSPDPGDGPLAELGALIRSWIQAAEDWLKKHGL